MTQVPAGRAVPANPSSEWGLAGFIISLVGVVSCPFQAPLGLVLSLVGLILGIIGTFIGARGFAIAGLVLGLIGAVGAAIILLALDRTTLIATAGVTTLLGSVGLVTAAAILEMGTDAAHIHLAVEQYRETHERMPARIEELSIEDEQTLTDPWGRGYRIVLERDELDEEAETLWLVSAGPDGVFGTADDVTFMNLTTGEIRKDEIERLAGDESGG